MGTFKKVLSDVMEERSRQEDEWGEQNHDPITWIGILTEEVGEAAKESVEIRFNGANNDKFREEMVQVAAVAVAIIECVDRLKRD